MAYADVASLSETINLVLNNHQNSISPQFKDRITSLHEHIFFLQSFFEDFPDESDDLEERTREVANAAEDIIELLLTDSLLESTARSSRLVSGSPIGCDFDDLERVAEEIRSIAKGVKERRREAAGGFGFDKDLIEIISRLRGGSPGLETITIVGMAGIGKSTLAKNAYNNSSVVEHFDIRSWVTISEDFSGRGIILGLLDSMKKLKPEHMSNTVDELFESVYNILFCKRYLIVLDDLWGIKAWDELMYIFPDNINGSRIMLTTRHKDVATQAASYGHIHEMSLMNVDSSWDMLKQKIFNWDHCPSKLEYIGKMIARSCRGIPLTIEVVSGILAADLTQAAWEDIVENMEKSVNLDIFEHVVNILCLSYTYLPYHLRACFLYLGIFPKDHEIVVSKVIKMWVAEGFLNGSESKSSEEIGEEYLEELVKRNLVSVSKRKSNGRIKCFSTHDLVRDLCIKQAHQEQFLLHGSWLSLQVNAIKHQRRVSISEFDGHFYNNAHGSTIRTLVCFKGGQEGFEGLLEYFQLLRILDLSNAHNFLSNRSLPDQVYELIHLRYLAFNYSLDISEAISNLQNLQTLIIRPTKHQDRIVKLPVAIWRMRQLRHVVVHSCVLPSQEEEVMFALENLQTLTKVEDFIFSRETLKMIPNLKKLAIILVAGRVSEEDCQLHNLILLRKLEILKINIYDFPKRPRSMSPPAFSTTLKELTLRGLRLPWEDMKVVGSLPNLQVLKLKNHACIGRTWETNEGGFSQLNFLLIDESDLEHWITKTSHFPRLKRLLLPHCWRLIEVPNDIGEIPSLEFIGLDERNNYLLESAKCLQDYQQSLGNNALQVRIVGKKF